MPGRRLSPLRRVIHTALVLLALAWSLFPLYWMAVTAFKRNLDIFSFELQLLPTTPTFENFANLFDSDVPVRTYFINSVITALGTCLVTIFVSVLAGYAFSRLRFRGQRPLEMSMLVGQMFPLLVLIIPLYLIYLRAGLLNTNAGLILAFCSIAVPVGVWFMKNFIDSVPRELDEAARIDGCGDLGIIRHILLPLIGPGIVAVGVFAFLEAWNNLVFPLAFSTRPDARTLPPGLLLAVDSQFRQDWGGLMAASILASIPPIVGFIAVQRWILRGLTSGALKG
ncbi:MAG: carbohydrate ABC transporter permease [Chloroflexi bacterium]|nr:carbohydrate ABC transporter permease [Chloroflexota bacterium]